MSHTIRGARALTLAAYDHYADLYDTRTSGFDVYRQAIVELLPLKPGDTVLDIGCGTGLCFPMLQRGIGAAGTIVGVDAAPDMLARAQRRVRDHGWRNVVLVEASVAEAELPRADHALFCATHDVLQSAVAIDRVVAALRPGATVAAGGGKWAPPWAAAVNAAVLALHAPYVADFTNFDKPWALLAERVPDLMVQEIAMGGGYRAAGRLRGSGAGTDPLPGTEPAVDDVSSSELRN